MGAQGQRAGGRAGGLLGGQLGAHSCSPAHVLPSAPCRLLLLLLLTRPAALHPLLLLLLPPAGCLPACSKHTVKYRDGEVEHLVLHEVLLLPACHLPGYSCCLLSACGCCCCCCCR